METTNTFAHSRSSLENRTWFQTTVGNIYTLFQTETAETEKKFSSVLFLRGNIRCSAFRKIKFKLILSNFNSVGLFWYNVWNLFSSVRHTEQLCEVDHYISLTLIKERRPPIKTSEIADILLYLFLRSRDFLHPTKRTADKWNLRQLKDTQRTAVHSSVPQTTPSNNVDAVVLDF